MGESFASSACREATFRATPPALAAAASIGHTPTEAGAAAKEASMARRLYYQDSYGRVQRARYAERSRGLPAARFTKLLMVLAVLVVLAQLVH